MLSLSRIRLNALALGLALVATGHCALAAGSTKDVVLDRVLNPVASVGSADKSSDAMAVSVLLESPDGTLSPKSTETRFRTGDRFRIKVIASRDAKLAIYNTTPRGELKPEPIWQGSVSLGQETITPRFALTSDSGAGTDQLHFVLEPVAPAQGVFAWLTRWFEASKSSANKAGATKDVRLDVQSTPLATYTLNANSQGLVNTIRIVHR